MSKTGFFVSLEGIEGAGKTTQLELLHHYLLSRGYRLQVFREPGATAVGEQIRSMLLAKELLELTPLAEFLLFSASRSQLVTQHIAPALLRGEIVLCDRFTDSSTAYQGAGRGIPRETIDTINHIATGGLGPDLTIVLDLPAELGLRRAQRRSPSAPSDRFESESLPFHQRIQAAFRLLAIEEPARIRSVDARQSVDQIHHQIIEWVEHGISDHSRSSENH